MSDKKILVDFSMYPLDKGPGLSQYVVESMKIIEESGLEYYPSPMSTAIEGTWDECISCIEKCFETMTNVSDRVAVNMRIDYRKGRNNALKTKLDSIESKLGHPLANR
ncbi:MTH1187 family thiamine-binding protein [Myxococcota bacterium]|nr:MTH1187 family thiamine-binding protein [Myxococcota bacterium]MBU1380055.1 MTH1187 family thiamine-binding protein [Myxococcota bacterium]MBU1495513.1 MTH1187 family thiamine-binding protein [Myxococcota bacterium]